MRDQFVPIESSSLTLRDLFAPVARHRTALAVTVIVTLSAAAVAASLAPPEFTSEMTLMVGRDRADPVVSGDRNAAVVQPGVGESELLSEAEMLKSRDLLEQVALEAGLHDPKQFDDASQEARARARVVRRLRARLSVTPIRRTTLIRVRYSDADPRTAARVLERLSQRYLDKHLAVHRPAGTMEFFGEQMARARLELAEAENRLTVFGTRERVVAPDQERTAMLQQLTLLEATLQQARAEMADAERRLLAVQGQLNETPGRQVTTVRTGANGSLVGQLKGRILEMELQRDELLRKFTPQYPSVVQLDTQLAHARETLAEAERAPILDETTDQNPTHQWLRNEEARIRAERAALGARVLSLDRSIVEFRERARRLDVQAIEQQEILRGVKAAEDTYLLYQRKEEESRISDALDSTRIANVKVADAPTVPQSESGTTRALILWIGFVASLILGVGAAYVFEWVRPVIYSSSDVQAALDVPVLAVVPASAE